MALDARRSISGEGTIRHGTPAEELLDLIDRARPSWHARAACTAPGVTADFFSDKVADVEAARAVCRGCPVAPQCGHYGADERFGVWGGVAPAERGRGRRKAG